MNKTHLIALFGVLSIGISIGIVIICSTVTTNSEIIVIENIEKVYEER